MPASTLPVTIKNTVLLGFAVIFILLFWSVFEIWKSYTLITEASDPALSTQRGFADAQLEYQQGVAHFLSIAGVYLGLSDTELETLPEYTHRNYWNCGFGLHWTKDIALNLAAYEYNEYYVTAYNIRLLSIVKEARTPFPSNH